MNRITDGLITSDPVLFVCHIQFCPELLLPELDYLDIEFIQLIPEVDSKPDHVFSPARSAAKAFFSSHAVAYHIDDGILIFFILKSSLQSLSYFRCFSGRFPCLETTITPCLLQTSYRFQIFLKKSKKLFKKPVLCCESVVLSLIYCNQKERKTKQQKQKSKQKSKSIKRRKKL